MLTISDKFFEMPPSIHSAQTCDGTPTEDLSNKLNKKPRKNRSAYSLYAAEVKPKLKASATTKISCMDLQATISNMWHELPEEEKKSYQDRANEEKLQYMLKLKKYYENANTETTEETNKPKAKRPYSGYCYFVKEIRQILNIPDTKFKMQEILKQASEKWRNLTNEEKAVYQEKAKLAKDNFNNDSTEDSELAESIKAEESAHSDISPKEQKEEKKPEKRAKKGNSYQKKKGGINFSKEIQERMEKLDQEMVSKKLKTENTEKVVKPSVVETISDKLNKGFQSSKAKLAVAEEAARKQIEEIMGKPTGLVLPRILHGLEGEAMESVFRQQAQMARDMALIMNYEQMKRSLAFHMMLGQFELSQTEAPKTELPKPSEMCQKIEEF